MSDEFGEETRPIGGSSCLLPLIWMVAGNGALFVLGALIAWTDSPLISLWSLGFWGVVAVIMLARYIDVTRCNGTTSDGGTPATIGDVKRHGVQLVAAAGAVWTVVHVV